MNATNETRASEPRAGVGMAVATVAAAVAVIAGGCLDDATTGPATSGDPEPPPLGLVEVTIGGIGTETMSASAAPYVAGGIRPSFTVTGVGDTDGSGDGTIQLEPVSVGSFTDGERGAGGVRHLHAVFRIRNAQTNGTAYDAARENLTLLAVDTDGTHGETAVSTLVTFGGTEVTGAEAETLARSLVPAGQVHRETDGTIASSGPDVLQVLTETEAGAVDLTGTTANDVFPYGYVVRSPAVTPGSRTLPASPVADRFDGIVTFAFIIPLQPTAAEDPFEISMVFLPVDDDETRVTQSLEEQNVAGQAAFEARAAALAATTVSLLPGGGYSGTAATARTVCRVRTAGTAGAPDEFVVHAFGFVSLAPDPYATDGSASFIASPTDFDAIFDAPVDSADHTTFVVHGFQQGRHFVGQSYSGNGTTTVTTPSGSFFPGETVEVTLTPSVACLDRVARYRVASAAAAADFTFSNFAAAGDDPVSVAIGDLDGDGVLDLATANANSDNVSTLLGNGNGTFQTQQTFAVGNTPSSVAIGDLDGDGVLDLATANYDSDYASVLVGNGDGTFQAQKTFTVGDAPQSVAIGDLDGDGVLDLAVANELSDNVSIRLGRGNGTFQAQQTFAVGGRSQSVAIGDLDGDGVLDLATANFFSNNVSTLLGNGDGTFQAQQSFAVGDLTVSVALGDLDGDGVLDLAAVNANSDNVSTLLGNGDGTFRAQQTFAVGDGPESVAIGDLDGDGVLDLATANAVSGDVSILLGNGDGTFQAQQTFFVGSAQSVAIGDLDGDGGLDLAAAGFSDVAIFLNDAL